MESLVFESPEPGPHLLILGGVHGNEPCGVMACRNLAGNPPRLLRGRVTCLPAVNLPAFDKKVRFIDRNLNRILGEADANDTEGRIAQNLKPYLADADYLLDLHSYAAGGAPFTFAETDDSTMVFARALPGAAIITGWQDNYARTFPDKAAPGIGTTEYARMHGCISVTFECGGHDDPASVLNGVEAITRALAHLKMIDVNVTSKAVPHVSMTNVFVKDKPGRHAKTWKHLEPIAAGAAYAIYEDGSRQIAPQNGVVILPFPNADIGNEWGYLGRPV